MYVTHFFEFLVVYLQFFKWFICQEYLVPLYMQARRKHLSINQNRYIFSQIFIFLYVSLTFIA